jgi:anti-sigma regulatory factor (Ser/Thr protein kinase)
MYAYENDIGHVEITCKSENTPGRLTIEILDSGKPFNPLSSVPLHNQNDDINRRRIGGLGILMIIQITDEVSYERIGESNRLTLNFDRSRQSGQQDLNATQ